MPKRNNEIRCCSCGKKLAEAEIRDGHVSILCKCGVTNLVTATPERVPEKVENPQYIGRRGEGEGYVAGWQRIEKK